MKVQMGADFTNLVVGEKIHPKITSFVDKTVTNFEVGGNMDWRCCGIGNILFL